MLIVSNVQNVWLKEKNDSVRKHKGLLSFFATPQIKRKKNIKAYIRRQKQLKRAFSPSQAKSTSQRVIFCARPDRNPVCVFLHRSANFGDSVEQISSHARTDEKTTLAQQDSETLPAGRQEAVVCNLFIAVVSASSSVANFSPVA